MNELLHSLEQITMLTALFAATALLVGAAIGFVGGAVIF
jgi:hypothetical protein